MGDIAASWVLQVGISAFPDLGAPCLIESLALLSLEKKVLSHLGIIYIGELEILFTPQSLHRSGEASRHRVLTLLFLIFHKKNLGSRGYLGIVPMVL